MNAVKVKFANPEYNYVTSVSSTATESDARKYFVGKMFDMGVYPKEDFQKCIDIEFTKSEFHPRLQTGNSYKQGGSVDQVRDILKQDYTTFVKLLGENIKDEKFRATIKRLAETSPIKYRNVAVSCESLLPTQNEISLEKSLSHPLTSSFDAERYLVADKPIRIKNRTIITCDHGKYIIDGHHRWSQVFVLNPKAKIDCTDFYELKNPISGLKATQLGVSADLGYVPTKQVKDTNLLTISEKELKEYVNGKITPEVVAVFKKHGISKPDEHIWKNVLQLKTRNKPIENASKKDIMPQTDLSDNYSEFTPDVSGANYPYSYAKGGIVNNWQVKRDLDDRYYSVEVKTGKPKWSDSPDMGYLYESKEEAESVKKFLGSTGLSVVPYDKDWWKKMQMGGNTGRGMRVFEIEFTWNKQNEDDYDSRKVNIIASSIQDAIQKATERYAKFYDGFQIVEAEVEEKYAKGGSIQKWLVWQDGREDDFQWSIIVDGVRIQGVITIKKFSPNYDTPPKVTISDFDYVNSSEKVNEVWKKHKDQLLDFVVAEIGRQHVYSLGQKFAKGGKTNDAENEIFDALYKIYSNPDNKDRYGQVQIFEYRESVLKKMLSQSAFDFLEQGKSVFGKLSTYGGSIGNYKALNPTSDFYQKAKQKFAKGGSLKKIRVGDKVIPYPSKKELVVERVFRNKDNEISYTGRFEGDNTMYEYILNPKDKVYKYAKGGGIGSGIIYTTIKNPIEYLKRMNAIVYSDLNYTTSGGINYYIGQKGNKAIVVAFIEDDGSYTIDKVGAKEMSASAKLKGIDSVELYTNYGLELHSKYEKPTDIGFDKIFKVIFEYDKGGKLSPSQKEYNKDVDAYKWFVVDLKGKRAVSGWEFKNDAQEALSDYDGDKNFKVYSGRMLKTLGIENPKEQWKTKPEEPTFVNYKGKEIIYSPVFSEYYVEDETFRTITEAKKYIDEGAPATESKISAYRKGLFAKGGETEQLSGDYKIFEGYDHYKDVPLYQVVGAENEYVGDWHTERKDAEKELAELQGNLSGGSGYAKGGGVAVLPKSTISEIQESIKLGYNTVVVGMIAPNRKGVMLINDNSFVRGVYPLKYKDAIQSIVGGEKYAKGGKSEMYISGDDLRAKLDAMSDEELLRYYVGENGFDIDDNDHRERIEQERDDVIDELVDEYVRMMKSTGRFYAEGGTVSEDELYNWAMDIEDENLLSWCGYNSKKEFEDSSDLQYSKENLLLTNFEDLEYVYNNTEEYGLFAKGGEVDDTLYGKTVTITKPDYSQATGKVVKLSSQSMNVDLGKGVKGVETSVWVTVVDKNGKEQTGTLDGSYAKGGAVEGYIDLSKKPAQVVNDSYPDKLPVIDIVKKSEIKFAKQPIQSSEQVVELMRDVYGDTLNTFESVYAVMLNKRNLPIYIYDHSKGGIDGTVMDANLILATANKVLAKGIILVHNHPSGNLKPSAADDKMTEKVKGAAALLDISLLDHIILTKDGFYSYAVEGKMERGGVVKKSYKKTSFKDKVQAIKSKLLRNKQVPKAVQKDYGKTFSPAEAEDSAKRIAGAMRKKELSKNKK